MHFEHTPGNRGWKLSGRGRPGVGEASAVGQEQGRHGCRRRLIYSICVGFNRGPCIVRSSSSALGRFFLFCPDDRCGRHGVHRDGRQKGGEEGSPEGQAGSLEIGACRTESGAESAVESEREPVKDDPSEVLQMAKLELTMSVAKMVEHAASVTVVDGSAAAPVATATYATAAPGMLTAAEEAYVRSRAGTGGDPPPVPPDAPGAQPVDFKYFCSRCRQGLRLITEFLLLSKDGTFLDSAHIGRLWGVCYPCSDFEDLASFKRQCRKNFNIRLEALGERALRVRDVVYAQSKSAITLKFPLLTNQQQRKLALARLEMMVLALGSAFLRAERPVQEAMVQAAKAYVKDVETATDGETVSAAFTGEAYAATTWLTEVAEGVWLSWACRRTTCKWFGGNHMWAKHCSKEQYRCPACGHVYKPWQESPELHPSQKALTVRDPLTGVCNSFGCVWPPNEEDQWLCRMVTIRARQLNAPDPRQLSAYMQSTAVDLSELLRVCSFPATWTTRQLSSEVLGMFDERTYPRSSYEHILGGFTGDVLSTEAAMNPFGRGNEWETLISLFARSMLAAEQKLRA